MPRRALSREEIDRIDHLVGVARIPFALPARNVAQEPREIVRRMKDFRR